MKSRARISVGRLATVLVAGLILSACGGGGGGGGSTPAPQGVSLSGSVVKGPLAGADIYLYPLEVNASGTMISVGATALDTGVTDAQAQVTGITIPAGATPPFIMEFVANATTTDVSTGKAPVITVLRSVVRQEEINGLKKIYATPLTTMAVNLALADTNKDNLASTAEFLTNLTAAAKKVTSTLGFGVTSQIDIFKTPPLLTSDTVTQADQENTALYRGAVEALAAVVHEIEQRSGGTNANAVLQEITDDLGDDGTIDGSVGGGAVAGNLDVFDLDPNKMVIPGDTRTVGDIKAVLDGEKTGTNATVTTDFVGGTTGTVAVKVASTNPDVDGDGTLNVDDAFPLDSNEQTDTDMDGVGNNADDDDDNDGLIDSLDQNPLMFDDRDSDTVGDGLDNCPTTPNTDQADSDANGIGNACDQNDPTADFDLDTITNGIDNCPTVKNQGQANLDGDAFGDACDDDVDGDGVLNRNDPFPANAAESVDTDKDGIGNNADTDDDNDGLSDTEEGALGTDPLLRDTDSDGVSDKNDAFPLDGSESVDTDKDGIGNNADTDDDNDGLTDTAEKTIHFTKPLVKDTDGDTLTDGAEVAAGTNPLKQDSDGDGVKDQFDLFPTDATETHDTDVDGIGNNGDNCPDTYNPGQENADGDAQGDVCDTDDDNDGLTDTAEAALGTNPLLADTDSDTVNDGTDNCPLDANTDQLDTDSDGMGNACDDNDDNDLHLDAVDNCPLTPNDDQADTDRNGIGDVCDIDTDKDLISDQLDNCPTVANTDQANNDGDTQGDVCDSDDDNDTVLDTADNCPMVANLDQADLNGNGVGDVCDSAPVAVDDTATGEEDMMLIVDVLTNDYDTNSIVLYVNSATNGAHGTTALHPPVAGLGSMVEYTPAANFHGSDSFTYTVIDEEGKQASATVNVTITPVNDAPVGVTDSAGTNEDTAVVIPFADLLANDTDVDGDTLSIVGVSQTPTSGALTTGTDSFTYTPGPNFSGTDSFVYVLEDSGPLSATATVMLQVVPVNDAPVAVNDTASAQAGSPVEIDVLANDSDQEMSALTITAVGNASNGTTSITAGKVTYTPTAGYSGSDMFTYTISDGALTATAQVTVNVTDLLLGIWGGTETVTTATAAPGASCFDQPGDSWTLYFSLTEDAVGNVTLRPTSGEVLAGTINRTNSTLTISASLPMNNGGVPSGREDITVTGTLGADRLITGTISVDRFDAANALQCQTVSAFSTNHVYTHTGSEDYNGLYEGEILAYTGQGDHRQSMVFHVTTDGVNINVQSDDESAYELLGNLSIDPLTGVFSFTGHRQDLGDSNGDGVMDTLIDTYDEWNGLFVRSPSDATGAPVIEMVMREVSYEYAGTYSPAPVFPVDVGGLTPSLMSEMDAEIYARPAQTQPYTRMVKNEDGSESVVIGLLNPPMARSGQLRDLYLLVGDAVGTPLCSTPFANPGDNITRMRGYQWLPHANEMAEAFHPYSYSSVACQVSMLSDNTPLVIEVVDSGPDRIPGNADDLIVESHNHIARTMNYAGVVLPKTAVSINGSNVLVDDGTGVFHYAGYHPGTVGMLASWQPPASTPDMDCLQLEPQQRNPNDWITQTRLCSPMGEVVIPAPYHMPRLNGGMLLRHRASYVDPTKPSVKSFTQSQWVAVDLGLYGIFDVDLNGDMVNDLVLDLSADPMDQFNSVCNIADAIPGGQYDGYTCGIFALDLGTHQIGVDIYPPTVGVETIFAQFSPFNGVQAPTTFHDLQGNNFNGQILLRGATPPADRAFIGTPIGSATEVTTLLTDSIAWVDQRNEYNPALMQDVLVPQYGHLQLSGNTINESEWRWDFATSAFVANPRQTEWWLTSGAGWQATTGTMSVVQSNANGSVDLNNVDGSGNVLEGVNVAFSRMDVSGMAVGLYLQPGWVNLVNDSALLMPQGSDMLELSVTQNQVSYRLWLNDCVDAAINNNCNTVDLMDANGNMLGVATTLAQVTGGGYVRLPSNGGASLYGVFEPQFGDVTFYTDCYVGDPCTGPYRLLHVSSFSQQTVGTDSVLLVNTNNLPDYVDMAPGEVMALGVPDGFVRGGASASVGSTSQMYGFNAIAMDALLGNMP